MRKPQIGAIVLAAGEAKRFGSPKQVLVYKDKTLVQHAVVACLAAGAQHIVVVTGAHEKAVFEALQSALKNPAVTLKQNSTWAEGMDTSIRCGMKALLERTEELDAVLVVLVDQPLIDAPLLRKLIVAQNGNDAAALAYPSGPGVPACFGERLFERLLTLTTEGGGAKAMLRDPNVKTAILNDPEKRQDIDTLADWHDFTNP